MDIEKIKEMIMPYLEENNYELYDISLTKSYGYRTLQILVDNKAGITIDELALINDYVSKKLDEIVLDDSEYMLEVSSPGAEKELRTKEDITAAINEYIHVKVKDMIYEGYLTDFKDDVLTIKINVKGRIKTVSINYSEIKKIRLAVKI